MIFCKDTRQEGFDSTKVNAIQVNDDKKESDKDSEGNSLEKCLKKIRKFVPEDIDHKAPESDSKDQTSDSSKSRIKGKNWMTISS